MDFDADVPSLTRELGKSQVQQRVSDSASILAVLKAGDTLVDGSPFEVIRAHPSGEIIGMLCYSNAICSSTRSFR